MVIAHHSRRSGPRVERLTCGNDGFQVLGIPDLSPTFRTRAGGERWLRDYLALQPAALRPRERACDCWGLACVIYREEFGVRLPDYLGYGSPDEHGEIAAMINGATVSPLWMPVTGAAQAFDIALFRRGRLSTHIGVVVRHGLMIHMLDEDGAKLCDYRTGPWHYRFSGHWRHRSRAIEQFVGVAQ